MMRALLRPFAPECSDTPCTEWNQCESWRCLDGLCSDNAAICDITEPQQVFFSPVP